ncbi:doublesex- and mab-3-related transcription factor C2-like [Phoca vitulina]|uniref:doublesex- and mab-3-related transcription factor C2-like n=1 Tax=Phoca vitulina TaxID=9720 RepID=UPI001395E0EF|nr:doublesex- and mab-3-related transcription factor C2-like [Phoca vitulina]
MDPNEMPAVPCCPSDSPTGLETGALWGIELGPKRAVSHCARCYNHGFTDQIKDQEHLCLFQACDCPKCAFFSEHHSVLPAESVLKREQGAHLKRHLAQGLTRSEASPPKAHSHVKKLAIQAGALSKRPRSSADWSCPKFFVSVLDSSSLEDATNNFSFQEAPQDSCPAQHAPEASDQDSVSASEWQRKLEAAEALLILRDSPEASSGSVSLLQPSAAAAPAGDRGPQPPSPSLRPRPASSISLPIGHLGCISLLS